MLGRCVSQKNSSVCSVETRTETKGAPTMPGTEPPQPSTDLHGTWSGEVRFTSGPLAGDVHQESWLFADDAILVHLRSRRGVGEWKYEGGHFSFAFYEVLVDDGGKPSGVVHITAAGTLGQDGNTFEAVGRGDVYGLGGELIATNHTAARAWRAARSHEQDEHVDPGADAQQLEHLA
jgi:hypothetical protein